MPMFHVTSALNRDSILAHGLDWTLQEDELRDNGSGHFYLSARVPVSRLTLLERDIAPRARRWD